MKENQNENRDVFYSKKDIKLTDIESQCVWYIIAKNIFTILK